VKKKYRVTRDDEKEIKKFLGGISHLRGRPHGDGSDGVLLETTFLSPSGSFGLKRSKVALILRVFSRIFGI
jgi:hypothetical protein